MRLLRTPSSNPDESLMGYLLRLTQENGYSSLSWIVENAKWKISIKSNGWRKLTNYLDALGDFCILIGKKEDEIQCLEPLPQNWAQVSLHNHHFPKEYIEFTKSRLCAACLKEANYIRKIWDLIFVTACPLHKTLLIDTCPICHKEITWERAKVNVCNCGFDFRNAKSEQVGTSELGFNLIIYEILEIDSGTKVDSVLSTNPLSKVPLDYVCELLISLSKFLLKKYDGISALRALKLKERHEYLLKVVRYFQDYPDNLPELFVQTKPVFRNMDFVQAIEECCDNDYLFFILVTLSEYENGTYNYPEFNSLFTLKDQYVGLDKIIKNLNIQESILWILLKKNNFVLTFKEPTAFFGSRKYISRKGLDTVRSNIKVNIDIYEAAEILKIPVYCVQELVRTHLLKTAADTLSSNFGSAPYSQKRINLDDIETLINKLRQKLNSADFQDNLNLLKGDDVLNKLLQNSGFIPEFIRKVIEGEISPVEETNDIGLFRFTFQKADIENFINKRLKHLANIQNRNIKKSATLLNERFARENKVHTRKFNFDKEPIIHNDITLLDMALIFKRILRNSSINEKIRNC